MYDYMVILISSVVIGIYLNLSIIYNSWRIGESRMRIENHRGNVYLYIICCFIIC